MTDEERAELAVHEREFGRLYARVQFSYQRNLQRLEALMAGKEPPPHNPMELSDEEWDVVRIEVEAWDAVLSRQRREAYSANA